MESGTELRLRQGARLESIERKRGVQSIGTWVGRRSRQDTTGALGSSNDGPYV